MKKYVFVLVSFFVTSAFAQTVATVGSKTIDLKEFNQRYDQVKKQTINPPPKEVFLEDLVRYEMGVQEAYKQGMDKDPQVMDRVHQELYKGLVEKSIGKDVEKISVTDDEMKAYYKKNPELKTSHILVELKPGYSQAQFDEAKKRAEQILGEVKSSKKPFEELVALYTDDVATRKNGGDVGWQTRLTVLPEYYEAAFKLKVGQLSALVHTPYGFHIIKLTGINSYEDASKRNLRAAVFDEKRRKLFDKFFDGLKDKYKISINKSALK